MPIGESVTNLYARVEDSFFNLADWMEAKGIPVYGYVNALEERGIPAFPVTIAILVLVLALIIWLVMVPLQGATTVQLSLTDDSAQALSGVDVKILDETGKELFTGKKSNGDSVDITGAAAGSSLSITGTKEGFDAGFTEVQVTSRIVSAVVRLPKQTTGILGQLRLIDSQSGTPVANAQVTVKWGADFVRTDKTNQDGVFSALGIPAGEEVTVEVAADGYQNLSQTFRFAEGETPTLSLTPDSTASLEGINLIIKTFDKDTQDPLSDVQVRLVNPQSNQALAEGLTVGGQFVVTLPQGTAFRVIASKNGYISATSEDQTLRTDPTQISLELIQGGNQIHVTVVDHDANVPLYEATVGIYSERGTLIEELKTPFIGSVDFTGLQPDQNYFITAHKDSYVPQTVFVSPLDTTEVRLSLETANSANTGTLNVLVNDSGGFAAENASLQFFELIFDRPIPIGLPTIQTAYDGFATIDVPSDRIILVQAAKGLEAGDANKLIEAGKENNVTIQMKVLDSARMLNVKDIEGNPFVDGTALIKSVTGTTVFDGNLNADGPTAFDAKNFKEVDITISDLDGNSFTERVNVETAKEITLQWSANNSAELSPPIEYLGIEDSQGKAVQGITPGGDYWLKFKVDWLKGNYRAGLHFRVGNDQTQFADSEEIGITGFDAPNVASYFYSRSYSAFPAPGNEAADFGNAGKAGQSNKWLELYFNNPSGSQTLKIKVQLKPGFSEMTLPIHYRAWALVNGNYFRNPDDSDLGTDSFSATKTALYAKTIDEEVSLFGEKEQCQDDVCAEYKFLSSDQESFQPKEFKALTGKVYALEVSVRSKKSQTLALQASTNRKAPSLFFTGSEVETFTEFMDTASTDSFLEINDLSVLPNQVRTSRIYFKPFKAGNTFIKATVSGEGNPLEQDFYFNVFQQSEMQLKLEPETVSLGEKFSVVLTDTNKNQPVTGATIYIKDEKGSIVASKIGNNSQENGANGRYSFEPNLGAGNYKIEATAFGVAPAETDLVIRATDVLKLPEEIIISIPKNKNTVDATAILENVSNLTITDLSIEIQKPDNWPPALDAIGSTASTMRQHEKTNLDITANYTGDMNKRESATATLIVNAVVSGKYPAVAKSRLTISYNQPFDPSCLEFDQQSLTVYLAANPPIDPYNQSIGSGYSNQSPYYSPLDSTQYYANPNQYNATYPASYANATDQQQYYNSPNSPYYNGYDPNYSGSAAGTAYSPYNSSYPSSSYPYNNGYSVTAPYAGTGNIFSNIYNNYNQTSKEIELQVTNKCSQAFEITGAAIQKSGAIKDEGLQITVPPFTIQPQETVNTTVTVSNSLDRFLPEQESHEFDLQFHSDSLDKSIPLNVVLWDSRYALAMRDSIVMFLSQGKTGEPVTASTPLFMRNVGATAIKNLRIEMGGNSYTEGVSIRMIPNGDIPLVQPGQVVYPPKMVVAEMKGGTEKGKTVHTYLQITGEIDGQVRQLRTVDMWVYVSALNCLYLTPVDDLEFISPESRFGVIDKKVKIRNTCEEPVRVVGIEPNQLGANDVFLIPVSSDYLNKDMEAEFIVRMAKHADYKNENMGFNVAGLTQLTQKYILSNRLQGRAELGEKAVTTGLASEAYELEVCSGEGIAKGTTMTVRFPKISKNADCEKGYCDAKQAVEFLAKRLEQKINQAQNTISQSNNQLENFTGCVNTAETKACTFTELGVPTDSIDLYLQNDQVTAELLQKQFAEKGPAALSSYGVNYCAGLECNIKAIAQTGFPNFLYLSNALRGCGKYRIKINGAAFVQQNQIRNEAFILSVSVQSKELTPECTNSIENVMNFLPADKELPVESSFGAWPGAVEADQKTTAVGNAFAKELFGNSEGRVFENTGSNKIHLEFGDVSNGLIKVQLEPGSAEEPRTVQATINQALNTATPSSGLTGGAISKEDLAKEAAQTVQALVKQRIQKGKGCISEDRSYFVLGSAAKLGDLTIGGENAVNVLPNQENCIDINVNSPIHESVQLKTNKEDLFKSNNGIAKITFRNLNGQEITEKDSVALEFSEKSKKYESVVKLCVLGNEQFAYAKNAKTLDITAQSTADSLRLSNTKKVSYQACGIHPYDLVNKMTSLQPGKEYYATVGWKGEPNKANLSEIINAMADKDKIAKKDTLLQGDGIAETKQATGKQALKDKRIAATLGFGIPGVGGYGVYPWKAYLPSCVALSAACNGVKTVGMGGWLWGPIFDCALPAAWMVAPNVGGMDKAREYISQSLGTVSKTISDKLAQWFPSGSIAQGQEDQFTDAVLVSVSGKSLLRGLKYNNILTSGTASTAAKRMADDIADQVVEQQLSGATRSVQKELKNMVSTELRPNIVKAFEEKAGPKGWLIFKSYTQSAQEKFLEDITKDAMGKTNLDQKLVDFAIANKANLKSAAALVNQTGALDDAIAAKLGADYGNVVLEGETRNYGKILSGFSYDKVKGATLADTKAEMWARLQERVMATTGWKEIPAEEHDRLLATIKEAFDAKAPNIAGAATESDLRKVFAEAMQDAESKVGTLENVLKIKTNDAADGIVTEIKNQATKGGRAIAPAEEATIRNEVLKGLKSGGDKKVERAFKAGLSAAEKETKAAVEGQFKSELKGLTQQMFETTAKGSTGIGFFRRFGKFLGTLGRGLVCGAVSNYAGLAASTLTMNEPATVNANTAQVQGQPKLNPNGTAEVDSKGKVLKDIELVKGTTYKIGIQETKGADGKTSRKLSFNKVNPDQIPKNAEFLNTDCTGEFANKDLKDYTYTLNPEKGDVSKKEQNNYYLANPLVKQFSVNYNIPEQAIMTAMAMENKYAIPSGCDPNHTFNSDPSNSGDAIGCAAEKLQKYYKSDSESDVRDMFTQYWGQNETKLGKPDKAPKNYLDDAVYTYKQWNK